MSGRIAGQRQAPEIVHVQLGADLIREAREIERARTIQAVRDAVDAVSGTQTTAKYPYTEERSGQRVKADIIAAIKAVSDER